MAAVKTVAADFVQATLPGRGGNPDQLGWKLDGMWINGSQNVDKDGKRLYETAADMLAAYKEHGFVSSKSKRSYIINDGSFQPIDIEKVKARVAAGEVTKFVPIDYTDLDDLL